MSPAQSWLSPKTVKRASAIHGTGLFASGRIEAGETVAIKGGYIFDLVARQRLPPELEDTYIQIGPQFFIGPLRGEDIAGSMMHVNHSCSPNVGVSGQIAFVAMWAIPAGQELTMDYAMTDDEDYAMPCQCGTSLCRGVVTGRDWRRPELQARYRGFFSHYLALRIDRAVHP